MFIVLLQSSQRIQMSRSSLSINLLRIFLLLKCTRVSAIVSFSFNVNFSLEKMTLNQDVFFCYIFKLGKFGEID